MLVSAWTEIIPGGIPSFQVVLLLSSNNPNVQLAGIFLVYTLCVVLSLPAKLSWYFSTWHHIYSVTALLLVLVLSTTQTQFMLFNPHLEPEILRILHPNIWCSALATRRFRLFVNSTPNAESNSSRQSNLNRRLDLRFQMPSFECTEIRCDPLAWWHSPNPYGKKISFPFPDLS